MNRGWLRGWVLCGLIVLGLGSCPLPAQINSPIDVPLVTVNYGDYNKLGIWLGIGGGTAPQLFEFDTGGAGLYAAYDQATPSNSPWWGSSFTPTGNPPVINTYDSGLQYEANVVESAITIYGSSSSSSALASTASTTLVGQTTSITDGSTTYWPGSSAPIQGNFYGDFGVSMKWGNDGIANPLAQFAFGPGVTGGFIVHAGPNGSTSGASMQLGLTEEDISSFTLQFKMDHDTGEIFPVSGAKARPLTLIKGKMTLSDEGGERYQGSIKVALDTGNPTPGLHNTVDGVPNDLIDSGALKDGLDLVLDADLFSTDVPTDYFSMMTNGIYGDGYVYVQDSSNYYLNIGIPIFYQYDVMFDYENGVVGFRPSAVPEPGTGALLLAAGLVLVFFRRRARV
jgi:hypothetical protein